MSGEAQDKAAPDSAGRNIYLTPNYIDSSDAELQIHLQAVIDAIPEVMMVIDREYRIVMANRAARELAGGRDPVAECMTCHALSHHDEQPCSGLKDPCPLQQVIATGKPAAVTHLHFDAEGRERFVRVNAAPILDKTGEVKHIIEAHRDITERKRAAALLKKERDFVTAVLNTASALVVVLDTSGRIVKFNRACEETTGYTLEEVEGKPIWDLFIVPEEIESVRITFEHLRGGELPSEHENYWLTKAGVRRLIAWSNTALYDEEGKVEYVVGTGIDVTQRKRTEEELKALNETLENRVASRTRRLEVKAAQLRALAAELTQAEQRERQRLAEILHDHLQQLLVGAKFGLDSLKQRLDGDERLCQPLDHIEEAIDQALTASRSLTVELNPPALQHGSLVALLRWLASWMKEKHGLAIELDADGEDDRTDDEVRVLLFQAVRELLFNVVKHAKVDQAEVQVLTREKARIWIIVTDNGVGFDPEKLQGPTGIQTGLGLFSIAERLELLGGQLKIDSAPGQGTCMTLWVPATRPEKTAPGPDDAQEEYRDP
jgi:PAS domain S-box-containing protein